MSRVEVLKDKEIGNIIKRLAYQILENNFQAKKIFLAGVNKNGLHFAKLVKTQLEKISATPIDLISISINPANPIEEISLSIDAKELKNQNVIVVDDVANTGRTIFYACKPLMDVIPKSIQVAVLVDRMHKSFPVKVDFLGLSLATTFKENITVSLNKKKSVFLE